MSQEQNDQNFDTVIDVAMENVIREITAELTDQELEKAAGGILSPGILSTACNRESKQNDQPDLQVAEKLSGEELELVAGGVFHCHLLDHEDSIVARDHTTTNR